MFARSLGSLSTWDKLSAQQITPDQFDPVGVPKLKQQLPPRSAPQEQYAGVFRRSGGDLLPYAPTMRAWRKRPRAFCTSVYALNRSKRRPDSWQLNGDAETNVQE